MKRLLLALTLLFCAAISAQAQQQQASYSNPVGANISASSTNCSVVPACVWQKLPITATTTTVTLTVPSAFSGTVLIETSADGGNTFSTQSTQTGAAVVTFVSTTFTDVRVRCSAFTSGLIAANIQTAGNQQNITLGAGLPITTVSGLNAVPGRTKGTVAVVLDGNSATDCTTGGVSTIVVCQFGGSTWSQMVASSSGATGFASITGGTNAAALVMGTGGTLGTSGTGTITATALSGTPALPNGTTATTQAGASNDTKVSTDAYVDAHFIASGATAMGVAAIGSGACATVVTVTAASVATTDVVSTGFNGDPTAVTGYGVSATGAVLTIYPYPTAGNVNFKVCNSTASSITPGALTLNWKVTR